MKPVGGSSPEERTAKLRNHFKNLLSAEEPAVNEEVRTIFDELPINTAPFTLDEIEASAAKLKNGKASGKDGMPPELLKIDEVQEKLLPLLNEIYNMESPPGQWLKSLIIPIHKKGDTSDPENYRGIALMSPTAKLLNRFLLDRIKPHIDPLLRPNQNGFQPASSTIKQVLVLRRITEECTTRKSLNCVLSTSAKPLT